MLNGTVIGIEEHFDAAHELTFHEGKCKDLHGHTWGVLVEVKRKLDHIPEHIEECEMIVDLSTLRKEVKKVIFKLDHKYVNAEINHPTCENIVEYFYRELVALNIEANHNILITRISVQEGRGGWAEWRRANE